MKNTKKVKGWIAIDENGVPIINSMSDLSHAGDLFVVGPTRRDAALCLGRDDPRPVRCALTYEVPAKKARRARKEADKR